MKLHRADHTMVRRSHLHSLVTAEVEHAVTLSGQFSYCPLCKVIVYRIVAVLCKGKYTVPELVQIMKGFRQVRGPFLIGFIQLYLQVHP